MFEVNTALKKRFCKDYKLSLKLYIEPYWTERLKLYENMYGAYTKWLAYVKCIEENFTSADDYLTYCKKTGLTMCDDILTSEAYKAFNTCDMKQYAIKNYQIGKLSVFIAANEGKRFISLDLIKANFQTLKYVNVLKDVTYRDLIKKYTDVPNLVDSKYNREVLFGQLNHSRIATVEKFLTAHILEDLLCIMDKSNIYAFTEDEIIIDITNCNQDIIDYIYSIAKTSPLDICAEEFVIKQVKGLGIDVFLKDKSYLAEYVGGTVIVKELTDYDKIELRCGNTYILPFILRYLNNEVVTENDYVFYDENVKMLARYIETPAIEIR